MNKYKLKNKIRIVTATSLFDGHDVAINIMRRIIQSSGAEVIHLGHDRSVKEIVECAIQEDVNAIALTSYQGGHMEYFKYMYDLLAQNNADHIKIFGGGGGVPFERRRPEKSICSLFSGHFGPRFVWKIVQNVPEYGLGCDHSLLFTFLFF